MATLIRSSTRRATCPDCNGPTYLWDRATGERVCANCTRFAPAGPGPNPDLPGPAAALSLPVRPPTARRPAA
jgi:hypothetical protein